VKVEIYEFVHALILFLFNSIYIFEAYPFMYIMFFILKAD
jgi:hypothetical protein